MAEKKRHVTVLGITQRQLRLKHQQTMKEMAELIGVTSNYLCALEYGRRVVPSGWYERINQHYVLTKAEQSELKSNIQLLSKETQVSIALLSNDDRAFIRQLIEVLPDMDMCRKMQLKEML